jgi:hypothetical protein
MGVQQNGSVMRPTSDIKEGAPSIMLALRSMPESARFVQCGDTHSRSLLTYGRTGNYSGPEVRFEEIIRLIV